MGTYLIPLRAFFMNPYNFLEKVLKCGKTHLGYEINNLQLIIQDLIRIST